MNLTELANLGEFIGGIAVVISLVYLALQVRQTNTWNRQQGFRDIQGRKMDWVEHVTSTKEMAHLYNTGSVDYDGLDEDDQFRFNWLQARRWATYELVMDYHRGGSMKDEILDIVESYLRQDLAKPGIQRWWSDFGRETFASDFRRRIDELSEDVPRVDEAPTFD